MKNILLVFTCAIFCMIFRVNSLHLSSNGGYNIVIAIEESTPVPTVGVGNYKENIKKTVQVLSNQLWRATNGVFFINSVDLLIPSSWNVTESDGDAIVQSYSTADVRLSENINYPYAENPNACGKAGEFIGLPTSFFENSNSGAYGPSWKALINLWARYRWGVWDEHGYIGDSETSRKFSYSYKPLGARNWVLTGCSNAPLEGTFVSHVDNDVICPNNDPLIPPSSECRFKPSSNNTATTSLMHLHWLDSVDSFCDHTNHNPMAPNKQNFHCDHRSIIEVMVSTADYATVTNASTNIPPVTFKTVRSSQLPLLYVLIDRGLIEGPLRIAAGVQPALISLFTQASRQNTIAAIGSFPGNVSEGSYVREEVPWSRIGDNQDDFLRALGHLTSNGPPKRDFGLALKEVTDKIKIKSPSNGAIILVVKYGSAGPIEEASFADIFSEAEVLAELKEHKVMVASIELAKSDGPSTSHLVNVARESGGLYTTLDSVGESAGKISSVVSFVNGLLNGIDPELFKNTKTIIKRRTAANAPRNVPVPMGLDSNLQIFYTTSANLSSANFVLNNTEVNNTVAFTFSKKFEWNEENDAGKKYLYTLEVRKDNLIGVNSLDLEVTCPVNTEQCDGNTLATAQFNAATFENVKVMLSTSSQSNTVDLSGQTPFSIFAKVTKNSRPISNVVVSAIISEIGGNTTQTVGLKDNGLGDPDLEKDDGVYSGYYIPKQDGSFKISVFVQNTNAPASSSSVSNSRLLPIDQDDFGCESGSCEKEELQGSYGQSIDLPVSIVFTGAENYVATPSKIIDLRYSASGVISYLLWTSPSIPGELDKVSSYAVKKSTTLEKLLNDFDNCEDAGSPTRPLGPGETQTQPITLSAETLYFAVRPYFYTEAGSISNIVVKEYDPNEVTPTPPTSAPTTPTTTTAVTGSTSTTTDDGGSTTPSSGSTTTPSSGSTTTPSGSTTTSSGSTTSSSGSTTPGEGGSTPSSTTVAASPSDEDPWIERPVGYITVIVIILAALAVAGGGYWYMKKKRSTATINQGSNDTFAVKTVQQEAEPEFSTV